MQKINQLLFRAAIPILLLAFYLAAYDAAQYARAQIAPPQVSQPENRILTIYPFAQLPEDNPTETIKRRLVIVALSAATGEQYWTQGYYLHGQWYRSGGGLLGEKALAEARFWFDPLESRPLAKAANR